MSSSRRSIWALVAVETLCLLGAEVARFGISIWIYESSRSVTGFSELMLANLVPGMLARPIAGSIVDRSSRKLVMIGASLASLVGTAIVLAGALAGELSMPIVIVGASIASIADSFQWPALEATIPLMASEEDLPRYNGFMESGRAIGHFAGPAIGGFTIGVLGVSGLVSFEVVTFAISIVVVSALHLPRPGAEDHEGEGEDAGGEDEDDGSLAGDLSLGFRWIFARKPLLKFLLVATFANFFLAVAEVVMQPYGLSFLGEEAYGVGNALFGAGMIVGGLLCGPLSVRMSTTAQFFAAALAIGATFVAFGLAHTAFSFAALNFVAAAMITIANASTMTIWQVKVPDALQGRVFSAMGLVADLTTPLAFVLAAPLTEQLVPAIYGARAAAVWGPPPTGEMGFLFSAMGAALVVGFVIAWTVRDVRQVAELPA
ncbi:MAG TPA: MFS transporter [Kofleriaceae bacterium]|nr:MFS transporter [Kofleriaceae bacterium]